MKKPRNTFSLLPLTYSKQQSKMTDKRTIANTLNEDREALMLSVLTGKAVDATALNAAFPAGASKLANLYTLLRTKLGEDITIERKGGLGAHWDFTATTSAGVSHRIELKCSDKKLSKKELAALPTQPWLIAVQFLQGQLKSAVGRRFLADCGDMMMSMWFSERITEFCKTHAASLPASCATMTEAEYITAMYDINAKTKAQKTPGYAFINTLRDNKDLATAIKTEWKSFQDTYLSTHQPKAEDILAVVKEIIEVKDWWICTTKSDVFLIQGLAVETVSFKESKFLKDTRILMYEMTVRSKGAALDTAVKVPLELRFHWKNGGQGVQNINFLLK